MLFIAVWMIKIIVILVIIIVMIIIIGFCKERTHIEQAYLPSSMPAIPGNVQGHKALGKVV